MPKLTTGLVCILGLLVAAAAGGGVVTHDAEIAGWCDGDNEVNVNDIRTLLENWGECEPPDDPNDPNAHCLGDLNKNGHVGEADLAILVGHWGPCHPRGDVNLDGLVDQADYDLVETAIRDEVECLADLDLSGAVDDDDLGLAMRIWTLNGYTHDIHYAAAEVDGDSSLSITDMILVNDAQDENPDCHTDVNRDRVVDLEDLLCICEYADVPPRGCPPP